MECRQAGGPNTRSASKPGQQRASQNGLNQEQQTSADADRQRMKSKVPIRARTSRAEEIEHVCRFTQRLAATKSATISAMMTIANSASNTASRVLCRICMSSMPGPTRTDIRNRAIVAQGAKRRQWVFTRKRIGFATFRRDTACKECDRIPSPPSRRCHEFQSIHSASRSGPSSHNRQDNDHGRQQE